MSNNKHKHLHKGHIMFKTDLLTVDELAKALKVKKRWVYVKTRDKGPNSIPRVQVGRHIRFEEKSVMDWLRANTNQQ